MKSKYRPFLAEFVQPLDKVHRPWIRRPALIMITPIVLIFGAIAGIIQLFKIMYDDCW